MNEYRTCDRFARVKRHRAPTAYGCYALVFSLALFPYYVYGADLMTAYRAALASDPLFAASRYSVDIETSRRRQAAAGLGPTLNANANANGQRGDAAFGGAEAEFREVDARGWSLQLSQPLFRYQNWQGYAQAKLQVTRADIQLAQARQELMLRVAQAYFDILSAHDSLLATDAEKTAVAAQLALAQRNFQLKAGTVTDVHEAQSRFDLVNARYLAGVEELQIKRGLLEQVTGAAPDALKGLNAEAMLPNPQPADIESWLSAAKERNLGVEANRATLEIAEREIAKARAGHYPTLDVNATYADNYASGSVTAPANIESRVDSTQVGVQFTVPLFASGGTSAKVREARAARDKANAELEAAKRNAAQSARQAYYGVTAGQARIESLQQAVLSSRSAVEGNRIGQRVGTRLNIDVLNAEQQLAAARRDLAKARYETLTQGLRLKATAGGLSIDDLAALNNLLETHNQTNQK